LEHGVAYLAEAAVSIHAPAWGATKARHAIKVAHLMSYIPYPCFTTTSKILADSAKVFQLCFAPAGMK